MTNRWIVRIIGSSGALAFMTALFVTSAHAAEQTDLTANANYLDGHRFTPSFLLFTPFAKPSLTLGISLTLIHPSNPAGGEDLEVAGMAPSIEGQIPIIKNLVLSLKASGLVVAGINAVSAVTYGATMGSRLQIGALYQFIDSSKFVLTGALTVGKPHFYSVSPLVAGGELAKNVFQGGASDVLFTNESTQWYPSIRGAYAFSPTIGMQAIAGGQFFTASGSDDARSQLSFGLGFDVQLKPSLNVPLALGAIYVRNQMLTRQGNQDTNTFAVSVFETFSPRFNFGTEFGWVNLPSTTAFVIGFMGRYYY